MSGEVYLDDDDRDLLSFCSWDQLPSGYWVMIPRREKLSEQRIYMHRFIMERWGHDIPDGFVVDHKNRCPWDNRKTNLRIVDHTDNNRNRRSCRNLPIGVYFNGTGRNYPYRVRLGFYGQLYGGEGCYATPEEAAHEVERLRTRLMANEYSETARFR